MKELKFKIDTLILTQAHHHDQIIKNTNSIKWIIKTGGIIMCLIIILIEILRFFE